MSDKEKSIEDLMDIAATPINEKIENEKTTDVHKFIISRNIKPGDTPIPTKAIWLEYIEFKHHHMKNCLSQQMFFRIFSKLFKKTQTSKFRGYLLEPNPFFKIFIDGKVSIARLNRKMELHQKGIKRGQKRKENLRGKKEKVETK
jgi:hypothetical protein